MKSTYELIGTFWDGRPANFTAKTVPYNPLTPELGTAYCLFDIDGKHRSIRLSTLFAVQNDADWEQIKECVVDCRQITVIDDCRPRFQGEVVQQFHERRLRQVLHLLQRSAPGALVSITDLPNVARVA